MVAEYFYNFFCLFVWKNGKKNVFPNRTFFSNLVNYFFQLFQVQHFKETMKFQIRAILGGWEKIGIIVRKSMILFKLQVVKIRENHWRIWSVVSFRVPPNIFSGPIGFSRLKFSKAWIQLNHHSSDWWAINLKQLLTQFY